MTSKKTFLVGAILAIAAVGTTGCGLRSADFYRDDVQKLLETKTGDIKTCYDGALSSDKTVAGPVTVQFTVAEDSGAITNPVVQGEANPALQECVVKNLEGLALEPPDVNPGQGTYTWEFTVGAPMGPKS